jgi:uncharacterized protein (TIGR01777 family)
MAEIETPENLYGGSSILITGGSGLIGRYLTSALLAEGYVVSHLSRNGTTGKVKVFKWDPENKYIDPAAFDGVDYLIHLAGANIGEKRWTRRRKEEIVNSRVASGKFLHEVIAGNNIKLKAFITASATGYYGSLTTDRIFTEEDPPSGDFLGTTCRLWEEGADLFARMGIRTVKIRTAVVLEKSDSALGKLMKPARFGLAVQLGTGRQYFPWIHIDDLCKIYVKAVSDEGMYGPYNAVSPEQINHSEFIRTMAAVMGIPFFLPPVPAWILRAAMGEMSEIVLSGSRISAEKIIKAGYNFRFEKLDRALKNIIGG